VFAPVQIIDNDQPRRTVQVRKRVWNAQTKQFDAVTFVRVRPCRSDLVRPWGEECREIWGAGEYVGAWWWDNGYLWLREDCFTFWALRHDGDFA